MLSPACLLGGYAAWVSLFLAGVVRLIARNSLTGLLSFFAGRLCRRLNGIVEQVGHHDDQMIFSINRLNTDVGSPSVVS